MPLLPAGWCVHRTRASLHTSTGTQEWDFAMTLDEAIGALASAEALPEAAITWALEHWDQVRPRAELILARYLGDDDRSENAESALFFLLHIAAEKADTGLHGRLCLLLCDPALPELLLGDATTETLPGLLISTYDGDPTAMQAVIAVADADPFARCAALLALTYLTHTGRLTHPWMQAYLEHLFAAIQPRETDPVWVDLVTAVAALGYTALVPQVEDAFRRGWVDPDVMKLRDFQEDLRDTQADPAGGEVLIRGQIRPFTDTIGALQKWEFSETAADREPEDGWLTPPDNQTPYVNPMRDVGRNDPCPCGSGKKYKKCCLVA